MINIKLFFDRVRIDIFGGSLSTGQVDGMTRILNEWEMRGLTDMRWLAYMLATVYHETAKTFAAIPEYGKGKGRKYGVAAGPFGQIYYGRGWPQLTWYDNYVKMGKLLNLPLAQKPDMLLSIEVSCAVLFEGMIGGLFTGKKLADYFSQAKYDPIGARRIINGTDKALLIADYHHEFMLALSAAQMSNAAPPSIPATPQPETPQIMPQPQKTGVLAFIIGLILSMFKRK